MREVRRFSEQHHQLHPPLLFIVNVRPVGGMAGERTSELLAYGAWVVRQPLF